MWMFYVKPQDQVLRALPLKNLPSNLPSWQTSCQEIAVGLATRKIQTAPNPTSLDECLP